MVYATVLRVLILAQSGRLPAPWSCSASPSRTCCATRTTRSTSGGAPPSWPWTRWAPWPSRDCGRRTGPCASRLIKLTEIAANVGLNLFFILLCRRAFESDPHSSLGGLWDPAIGVGYVFLANLAASGSSCCCWRPELRGGLAGFDGTLFRRLMRYSLPMVIIGLAGIVNEMLDRAALKYLLPYDNATNMAQLGIYSACYKLSILMTLFIQAFRYAGEPFFFAYAKQSDAGRPMPWCSIGSSSSASSSSCW